MWGIKRISDICAKDCVHLTKIKPDKITIWQKIFISACRGETHINWYHELSVGQIQGLQNREFYVKVYDYKNNKYHIISWDN